MAPALFVFTVGIGLGNGQRSFAMAGTSYTPYAPAASAQAKDYEPHGLRCKVNQIRKAKQEKAGLTEWCELITGQGFKDGAYRAWYNSEDGLLESQGHYRIDKKIGDWIECDRFGRCKMQKYNKGEPVSTKPATTGKPQKIEGYYFRRTEAVGRSRVVKCYLVQKLTDQGKLPKLRTPIDCILGGQGYLQGLFLEANVLSTPAISGAEGNRPARNEVVRFSIKYKRARLEMRRPQKK